MWGIVRCVCKNGGRRVNKTIHAPAAPTTRSTPTPQTHLVERQRGDGRVDQVLPVDSQHQVGPDMPLARHDGRAHLLLRNFMCVYHMYVGVRMCSCVVPSLIRRGSISAAPKPPTHPAAASRFHTQNHLTNTNKRTLPRSPPASARGRPASGGATWCAGRGRRGRRPGSGSRRIGSRRPARPAGAAAAAPGPPATCGTRC